MKVTQAIVKRGCKRKKRVAVKPQPVNHRELYNFKTTSELEPNRAQVRFPFNLSAKNLDEQFKQQRSKEAAAALFVGC